MLSFPLNAPAMSSVMQAFAIGVNAAQSRLDIGSLQMARAMAGLDPAAVSTSEAAGGNAAATGFEPVRFPSGRSYNLLELGFTPTFYRFTEAVFELKVAVSVSLEEARSGPVGTPAVKLKLGLRSIKVSAVNGQYASRYQYASESSSRIRSKIVSVPAPNLLEERVRAMLAQRRPQDQAA
jgi:hypothetical protein